MRLHELTVTDAPLIETLRRDCGEYLSSITRPLYRGIEFDHDVYLNVSPRHRGKSLSYDEEIEMCVDRYLKGRGIIARRLTSAFCTDEFDYAKQYGDVYYMFPKNGFKFAYGSTRDMYPHLENWLRRKAVIIADELGYSNRVQECLHDTMGDLHTFGIYLSSSPKMREFFTKTFLRSYGFTDRSLSAGMDDHSEIWITGQYHLVKVGSEAGNLVAKEFGF